MKNFLLLVLCGLILATRTVSALGWSAAPPVSVAAGQSYTVKATHSQTAMTVTVSIYKNGASVASNGAGGPGSHSVTASYTSLDTGSQTITYRAEGWSNYSGSFGMDGSVTATTTVVKATPTLTWNTPAAITYGTALSSTQLNATASVPGTFTYSLPVGTVLVVGNPSLTVWFTPTDTNTYNSTSASVVLAVNRASLTITPNNTSKTYGNSNPGFSASYSGLVNGDGSGVVSGLSLSTTAGTGSSVGSYAITASGATAANYSISYGSGYLYIGQAPLTITPNNASKTYGNGNPGFSASYSGLVNGDGSGVVSGLSLSTTASTGSSVGSYAITASGASATNYSITYGSGILTIGKASLTITPNNASKTYGSGNPGFSASYSGLVNGDGSGVVSGLSLSTTAGTGSSVGSYPITASGASATNYSISYGSGILTIGKTPLTITPNNASKLYGAANPAFSASYSGLINGDTSAVVSGLSFSTAANAGSPVGSYAITASGATATNYSITYVSGTLTIGKAVLMITPNNASKNYGEANPGFSASYAGLLNGDTSAVVSNLSLSTTATTSSPAGMYPITASGATAINYTINYGAGTLSVGKSAQAAVSITSPSTVTVGTGYTALASGGSGTGAYAWMLGTGSTAPGAAINAATGVVTFTSAGTVVFKAYREGDANYNQSATTADFTLTVIPQKPAVTSGTTASGQTGVAFTYQITATNNPTGYSITGSLPAGLTLNPTTGLISGIPTSPGTYTFTVNATNAGGSSSATITLTILASLPYTTDFETVEGFSLGSLESQCGWSVTQGSALVSSLDHSLGSQSVQLSTGATPAKITQTFAASAGQTIEFVDFFAKPVAESTLASATTFTAEGARFAFLLSGSQGILQVYSGNGSGGGTWQSTGFSIPLNASQQAQAWVQLTARLDFTAHKWDLYANGKMVASDVPFINASSTNLSSFLMQGDAATASGLDDIYAGPINPLFVDSNNNGLDDAWETAHGLSLANNNRNTSPTNNGVTVVQAYVAGTDPTDYFNGTVPTLVILGGNNQVGMSGQFNGQPFDIGVWNPAGTAPVVNAPVTFTVQTGGGKLAINKIGNPSPSTTVNLMTDAIGTAQIYYLQPTAGGVQSQILISAGTAQKTFYTSSAAAVDTDGDGIPDAWEIAYGLDPNNPDDATALSFAAAGTLTNLAAYQSGLYPLVLNLKDAPMPTPPTGAYQVVLVTPGNNIYGVRTDWQITHLGVPPQ